jgi:hypothetical protein
MPKQVLDRVTCAGLFAPPLVTTNSEFRFVVAEQVRARGVKAGSRSAAIPQRPLSAACRAARSAGASPRQPR